MKKVLLILFMALFLFSFVSSAPPIFEIKSDTGYIVESTLKDYIRTGEDHEFEIHVFNVSNGFPITNGVCCYMHLYHERGNHEFEGEDCVPSHTFDYAFDLNGTNFTSKGIYQAKFQCNDSVLGGGTEIDFGVNDYGEELTIAVTSSHNQSMWFLMILFGISLIGLFAINNPSGKLACYWFAHLLFVVGTFAVWQFNQGYALSYEATAGIFRVLFYVSITAVFPMILASLSWIFYIHTMNDDIKKMMDKGMDEDEAVRRTKQRRKGKW